MDGPKILSLVPVSHPTWAVYASLAEDRQAHPYQIKPVKCWALVKHSKQEVEAKAMPGVPMYIPGGRGVVGMIASGGDDELTFASMENFLGYTSSPESVSEFSEHLQGYWDEHGGEDDPVIEEKGEN